MSSLNLKESRTKSHLADEQRVIQGVLRALGKPQNLYRINAERLWDNQFRVNVYCSEDSDRPVRPVRMTDSYFVTLTEDGIVSEPPISRRYASS